jgi:hypothetical protein
MKQIILCFLTIAGLACTKEHQPKSLVGDWVIIERNQDTGGRIITENFTARTELILHFRANGAFYARGRDSGFVYSPLSAFDRYEVLANHTVKFYNTSDTMIASFALDQQLSFNYPTRCLFEEKFVQQTK